MRILLAYLIYQKYSFLYFSVLFGKNKRLSNKIIVCVQIGRKKSMEYGESKKIKILFQFFFFLMAVVSSSCVIINPGRTLV